MEVNMSSNSDAAQLPDFHHYTSVYPPAEFVKFANLCSSDVITLFIEGQTGAFPAIHPKRLKTDLEKNIQDYAAIDSVKITKQGKILLLTHSVDTAAQVLQLQAIADVPVTPRIQYDSITTKFLLYGIPVDVSCEELADELVYNGVHVLEIRRFLRKNQGHATPTTTVLVSMLGTQIPSEVKLYYQIHKLTMFIDRPRPCLNCWQYNHNTKSCRSDKLCKFCSVSHEGKCQGLSPKCSNCQGEHTADDKSCPLYERETRIQKYKCEHHLSIAEARRRFRFAERQEETYASKLKSPPTPDVITQSGLQETLELFTNNMCQLFQNILLEQAAQCSNYIEQASSLLDGKVQAIHSTLQELNTTISHIVQHKQPPPLTHTVSSKLTFPAKENKEITRQLKGNHPPTLEPNLKKIRTDSPTDTNASAKSMDTTPPSAAHKNESSISGHNRTLSGQQ